MKVKSESYIMSSKKIFIDATGIVAVPTGLGKYSYYLLESMLRDKNSHFYFTVLHQSGLPKSHSLFRLHSENLRFLSIKIPVIGPKRDIGIIKLKKEINQHDLFHCLSSYMPAFDIHIPSVVTIHDLKYLLFPDFFNNRLKVFYYSWIIRRGIRKAKRIIAISESTKKDLIALGAPAEKVSVIYEASSIPLSNTKVNSKVLNISDNKPFLLFVGDNRPHKNIARIIQAHQRLLNKLGETCPLFVFAGPNFEALHKKYAGREKLRKLVFLGSVSEEILVGLYKRAIALVYPSLYEGFGLPILEAMSVGIPVITSNLSSMPEVAGQAAMLINPYSVDQLAEAIIKIVQDKTERERLRRLGVHRVRKFSWKKAARMTVEIYEGILSSR